MCDNNPRGIVAKNPVHPDKFTVSCGECGEMLLTDAESLDGVNYILKKHYAESHDTPQVPIFIEQSTTERGKMETSKEAIVESMNYPGMYMVYCPECHKLLSDKADSTDEARGILNDHMKAVHDPALFIEQYDEVDCPEHYAKGSLECIDWIRIFLTEEEYHGYLKGNILKYLWRHEDKGKPVQDLEKLRKYAEFLIDQFEREETERDILEENKRCAASMKTRRIMRGEAMSSVAKFIDDKLAEMEEKESD